MFAKRRALLPGLLIILSAMSALASPAQAQSPGSSSSGGTTYLPYSGGFVPYTGGTAGGLGGQPGMAGPVGRISTNPPSMGSAMAGLGGSRGAITPLRPLGISGSGMGMGAGLVPRRPFPMGGMGTMARPPVGNYPFRIPPSLVAPGVSAAGMTM
jgi:hypothetical protein